MYLQEAENLYHWCLEDKEALTDKNIDWSMVEDLPVRCGALREAQSRWITTRFSHEEIDYLERHAEWLSGLVSGELQPNACEQVRLIAVSNGVLRPRTEAERIWVKYRRLGYTPGEIQAA